MGYRIGEPVSTCGSHTRKRSQWDASSWHSYSFHVLHRWKYLGTDRRELLASGASPDAILRSILPMTAMRVSPAEHRWARFLMPSELFGCRKMAGAVAARRPMAPALTVWWATLVLLLATTTVSGADSVPARSLGTVFGWAETIVVGADPVVSPQQAIELALNDVEATGDGFRLRSAMRLRTLGRVAAKTWAIVSLHGQIS